MALVDLFTSATLVEVQAKIAQYAAAGNLLISSWYSGSPPEQLYQAFSQALAYYTDGNSKIIRGFFLDLATDPGDYDPYDSGNEALTPAPGFLSALGENCFFTIRPGATFATTDITMLNGANVPYTFGPDELTIAVALSPTITYRNGANADFYTGPGGTYTLLPGATATVSFTAEQAGTSFDAAPSTLTSFVSALPGVTVTNPAAALGTDRMSAANYRALCRRQAAAISPNGAAEAYLYLATTNIDGTPLLQSLTSTPAGDGITPVGITRVYVSPSSATGAVTVYYADDVDGAAAADVAAANENIAANAIAVPGCITFTGATAIATNITVTWAVEYKALFQGVAVTGAIIKAAINAALTARFRIYPIGGFKQTAGAGTISLEELRSTVKGAHPNITDATLSSPGGATALAAGRVAVNFAPTGTETAV